MKKPEDIKIIVRDKYAEIANQSKTVNEASCCGTGNWLYATVPGYVLAWHTSETEGLPATDVQPIADRDEREEVARIIENAESVEVVTFW